MGDTQTTRQELENLLGKRLEDAKFRLDLASKYVKEVERDLKSGTISPHPMVIMLINMPFEPRPWLLNIIGSC